MRDDSTAEAGFDDLAVPANYAPAATFEAAVFDGWSPCTDAFGAVRNDATTALQP